MSPVTSQGQVVIGIEAGRVENAKEICELVRASIIGLCALDHKNDKVEIDCWLRNKTVENFRLWIESNRSFCAFDQNQKIVGVLLLSPRNEILLNYVSPSYHNNGIGRLLMNSVEANVAEGSAIKANSTKSALGFYKQMGFTNIGSDPYVLQKKID